MCVAVCAVTVDMELANEAVCLGRTRQSQEHPTPDHISSHTMVVLANVTVRTGRSPVGKQNSLRLFCVRKETCREWREPGTPAAFARLSSDRGGSLTFLRFSFKHFHPLLRWVSTSFLLIFFVFQFFLIFYVLLVRRGWFAIARDVVPIVDHHPAILFELWVFA